ncbi:MAG: DUF5522 domain-containing protein [Saprospiraceae bacterium]|jgi:hypothetical protein
MFGLFNKNKNTKSEGKQTLKEGEDYYVENGFYVFTEKYHLKRGYCCGSKCRHCPYNHENVRS